MDAKQQARNAVNHLCNHYTNNNTSCHRIISSLRQKVERIKKQILINLKEGVPYTVVTMYGRITLNNIDDNLDAISYINKFLDELNKIENDEIQKRNSGSRSRMDA